MSAFLVVFIQFFYMDSFYSSNSFYSRIAYNYEILTILNYILFNNINKSYIISKEVFLIYKIIVS